MPRHKKSKPKTGPKFKRVAVESASLIQIDPDDELWTGEPCDGPDAESVQGSIVKLVPAPGTAEPVLIQVQAMFYSHGAASVKVMPVQEEEQIVVDGETVDSTKCDDDRSLRQVVMERAARTTNAYDQAALEALLTKAMDHAEAS